MTGLWNKFISLFRTGDVKRLQADLQIAESTKDALELAIALLQQRKLEMQLEYHRTLTAFLLQHGGEFILDHTFLEMADGSEGIRWETTQHSEDPNDKSTRYWIERLKEDSSEVNGYDLTEDDGLYYDDAEDNGTCCPDSEACNGGCSN